MRVEFAPFSPALGGTLVVTVGAERQLGPLGAERDLASGGILTRAMAAARFSGRREETLEILAPSGLGVARVLLVGMGKPDQVDALAFEAAAGAAVGALARSSETEMVFPVEVPEGATVTPAAAAQAIAAGSFLRSWRFDRYRTTEKPEQKPALTLVVVQCEAPEAATVAVAATAAVAEGVFFTRDLVTEPGNILTPIAFAERCRDLTTLGVEVTILDEAQMRDLGMGALLGVAQGSVNPPRLVALRWSGAPGAADQRPVAFVGKGVTFDSGGISLKPGVGMEDMKWDMAGAGVVAGLFRALAGRKAPVNAVGILGLVENMPSGTAQRPGDVVTSLSGQTIEVLNTDAEGRLVLADALAYTQKVYSPRLMIDLATLTGAIIIALGHEQAGLFANDDSLARTLESSGAAVGEPLWRLPMGEAYDKELNSDIADMKNIGGGRAGGSILGAQFLKRFVKDVPWAHLDIAGVAWAKKGSATVPKGASGFGVRLLDRFVSEHCEERDPALGSETAGC